MKTKIYHWILLISIFLIEMFGFNDKLKYYLISKSFPDFGHFFIINIVWFKFSIIAVLTLLILLLLTKLKKRNIEQFFLILLYKRMQKRYINIIGLASGIFVLNSLYQLNAQIAIQSLNGILNGTIYLGFLILYVLIVANYFISTPKKDFVPEPKVLIAALSLITEESLVKSLAEMEKQNLKGKWRDQIFLNENGSLIKSGTSSWGPWGNLDPIRKSIIVHHDSLEMIVLVSSFEATNASNKLRDDLKPQKLIADFLSKHYPHHKINNLDNMIVADGSLGNDMFENTIGIEAIINKLINKGYKNEDIVFNITGATVAISGAMILKAIPYERRAEYTNQVTGLIVEVPLSIFTVKELWNELFDKVDGA